MIGIRFKILNEYNTFLDKILTDIDSQNYIWEIIEEEVLNNDGDDLFKKEKYSNEEFKNIIKGKNYYTIFLNLQLYKENTKETDIYDYSDFINSDCELVLFITDNEYVDIYCKSKEILEIIKNNAVNNGFSKIEQVFKNETIRKQFSAYTD